MELAPEGRQKMLGDAQNIKVGRGAGKNHAGTTRGHVGIAPSHVGTAALGRPARADFARAAVNITAQTSGGS